MSRRVRGALVFALVLVVAAIGHLRWNDPWGLPPPAGAGFAPDDRGPETAVQKRQPPLFKTESVKPSQGVKMVHVGSLAECPKGTLVMVWYGGTAECTPDVKLFFARRGLGDNAWSPPEAILSSGRVGKDLGHPVKSLGNAILLPGRDGALRLLFTSVAVGKWSGCRLLTCVSRDAGKTWTGMQPLRLSPFFNFSEVVRNRPVPLIGGGWCVPIYHELTCKYPEILWLGDRGETVSVFKTRIAGGRTTSQPSLVPLDEKRAIVLLRAVTDVRKTFVSRTGDAGLTWTTPEATELPNPDSGISALALSDGRILLAFNDSPENRNPLSLAVSSDEGRTWKRVAVLESAAEATFSYPYLMRSSDGLIRLAYTYTWEPTKTKEIRVSTFNEAWIASKENAP